MDGKYPRAAAHSGCICGCKFVPDSAPPPQPSLTVLQEVMAIGPVELGSLHAHMQGEFNRHPPPSPPPPKPHIFLKIFIFVSIRRAGMVAKHDRMQAQSFFRSHVEFMKNASPVQPYHTLCTEQFFQEGKAKAEAASPATKALLLQSPSRPANIMKPFKCAVPSRLQLFFVVRSL